jgi:rhodanese-related sulfurtransferase
MEAIDLETLQKRLTDTDPSFYIVDVREPEEYEAGHIPNALLMPWHLIEEKIHGVHLSRELILYCETGVRAQKAAHALEQRGYEYVRVYKPGWEEWERYYSA